MGRACLVGAVLAALAASVLLAAWQARWRDSDVELDRVAQYLRTQVSAADLVVVDPSYVAGVRQRLGDLPIVDAESLVLSDVRGTPRIYWLTTALPGRRGTAWLAPSMSERPLKSFDTWHVSMLQPQHALRRLVDLPEDLALATVSRRDAQRGVQTCDAWRFGRRACGGAELALDVGRHWVHAQGASRACLWLYAPPDAMVQLDVAVPPAADRRVTAYYAQSPTSTPWPKNQAQLRLYADNAPLPGAPVAVDGTWQPWEATLDDAVTQLRVQVDGAPQALPICLNLHIVAGAS